MKTTQEKIEVMQAHIRGEKIQWRDGRFIEAKLNTWEECDSKITWNWEEIDYRIRPKAPREWYMNISGNTRIGWIEVRTPSALLRCPDGFVHVREVIE